LNNRITNIVTNLHKPVAFSEYGCGGTQHCHSDDFKNTTTTGNYGRHDIEYMMWLHEGHVTAIRNFPQLMFTAQWQLFDIAVSSRNEGYTECLDGTTTSTNDELRRLNNKGLVERDHVTKKDPFYLYKAEWNPTPFVHICCKDYTKITDRVLKCYTNDGNSLSLYDGNNNLIETVQVTDHIALFTSRNFTSGVTYKVQGSTTYDTVTF
jgi:beta-galactosidase